jgi:hypothetical protein
LWDQVHLQFAAQHLAFELGVLAHIAADHLLDLRVCNNKPNPKSSTPALLLMHVRPFTPLFTNALMLFSGMPHRPKPPTIRVMLSCDAFERFIGVGHDLVHRRRCLEVREVAGTR